MNIQYPIKPFYFIKKDLTVSKNFLDILTSWIYILTMFYKTLLTAQKFLKQAWRLNAVAGVDSIGF